jgi:hypothetical protein
VSSPRIHPLPEIVPMPRPAFVPTRGIPVREPWISLLLGRDVPAEFQRADARCLDRARKTLEIRGKNTTLRGPVALIASGTGTVLAVADLVDVLGPLDVTAYHALREQHLVRDTSVLPYRTTYGYVMRSVRVLRCPIPYRHKSGAVSWVVLDEGARRAMARELAHLPAA